MDVDVKNKGVVLLNKQLLVAPCGLDCFNCPVFEDNITEDIRKGMSQYQKIPPEDVACKGCKPEQGRCRFTQNCATWACSQEKGVSFCYECGEFPCGLLAPSAKGASYPHNMKVYNLCRMKLVGLEAWIEESDNIRRRYYEGNFIVWQGPVLE
ncbi:MAG: DUF3795 domain-containing protein [Clostridiales bacterium]|nr:DUF3795 domain-containing protein [Clostridiales bacterium]